MKRVFGAGLVGAEPAQAESDLGPTVSVRTTASGLTIQKVKRGAVTVTTYGQSAPVVEIATEGPAHEASVEVVVDLDGKADVDAIAPTVYEMTLATGDFSPEEACEFAMGMDGYGCQTSAEVEAKLAAKVALRHNKSTGAAAAPGFQSRCFDFKTTKGDGEKKSHNCVTYRKDFQNGSYKWIANKMKSTGWENDTGTFCDCISGVGIQAKYQHDDAHATDWEPSSSRPYSSCSTRTVTVQGRSGSSYSQSTEVCEDLLSPWHSPAFQYFGAKWTGPAAPRHHERGVVAASVVKIPRNGTESFLIEAWLRWS